MRRSGPSWREVWLLYTRELRSAFRERSIVVNSVLLPILLYPFIIWLMLTGVTFVMGLSEGLVSRIAVLDPPAAHRGLGDELEAEDGVELVDVDSADAGLERIREEELDALVEFLPVEEPEASRVDGNFRIRLSYDGAEERSRRARDRVEAVVNRYRESWLEGEAGDLGLSPTEIQQYLIASRNVASSREMGTFVLGQMVPLFLVLMVALGCFVPAVDSTAGERERSTWETTMSLSASRGSIVTAKYLYVATLGTLAGILNVLAVTLSMGPIFRPLMEQTGEAFSFSVPLRALPLMVLGAALLALFFGAAMMILASFARTFKDGQAMVTPVTWLAIIPLILGDTPEQALTPGIAAIPVVNVAAMIRDAIVGIYQPLLILETLAVGLILVGACLWLARRLLEFEDHLLGSYGGSFWKFARDRMLTRDAGQYSDSRAP